MQIEHLREFVTFSRFLNFSKAASYMNLAQPTLSSHIANMENELGFKLVRRKPMLELTAAGKRFCVNAIRLLEDYDATVERCASIATREAGALVFERPFDVGGIDRCFDEVLDGFRNAYPDIVVQTRECQGLSESDALLGNVVDLVFMANDDRAMLDRKISDRASVLHIPGKYLGPYYLWMDESHPLAKREELALEELDGCRFLIPADIRYQGLKDLASVALDTLNIKSDVRQWPGSYEECIRNIDKDEVMIVSEQERARAAYGYVKSRIFLHVKGFHKLIRPCFVHLTDNANPAIADFAAFLEPPVG